MGSPAPTGQDQRPPGHVWRFAGCEFDERGRELRVRGAPVDVEAKPLEVLHQLLLHAGEVVTKAELLDSVWPGTNVVDGSLATAVSKVRKLLVDDEKIIVTVPRVGYKLAVPVHCHAVAGPPWPDLHFEPGQHVPGRDQWRLVRRLDLSPSSEVWLGQHPKTHETRVFKFAPDDLRLKCLKREVTVARLLRESLGERPEFVRVLEWNFDTPPYFIESEYAGPNLAEWAEAQGGLPAIPLERRLRLLADVATAIEAAHRLDVLHKDLKPGNILVSQRPDGTQQIKVADFGSASLLVPGRLDALGITNLGFTQSVNPDAVTGTVIYMAPEVLGGQSPSAASDVYALGVLLYQIVVGDFRRQFAPGWETDVADPLIREDIAEAACGDPARRMTSAADLAERLLTIDRRRIERTEVEEARRRALTEEQKRANRSASRRWLMVAGVAVLLTVAAGVTVFRSSVPVAPRTRSVAVLPFGNVGADPDLDFLRLALADEVATILNHSRSLAVRPFATSSRYDQPDVDLQRAGREMRASAIVTGHFIKAGEQLQITVEAIDVDSDGVLWRGKIDAPARSLIATQVQIALRVRGGLVPAFGASSSIDAVVQPKNEEAYNLFLRSLALTLDPAPNPDGIAMLERAVDLDPTYAPSWMALARRYYVAARYATGDATVMDRYDAALERAAALDPAYIPAAAGLVVSRVERGDLVGAYERAQDLVRRRPDSVDAHFVLSYVLRFAGLLDESADQCDTAFLLDPQTQTSGLRSCAIVFLLRGDYPRAMNYLQLDLGSDFAKAFSIYMLVRQGKEQEALQLGAPNMPQWKSYDMVLACAAGKPSSEIDALSTAVQPADDPEANYLTATHLAYCGRTRAALDMLQRAVTGRYCSYPAMDSDPFFRTVRNTAEFAELRAAGINCQKTFLARTRR